jgi:hypothetical protein
MSGSLTICAQTQLVWVVVILTRLINRGFMWLGNVTHKINREHKTFEVLALQGIEYPAFLKGCEESERKNRALVPSSLVTGLPRL